MMLKNMFRLIKKGKKGFSLAELMVVVAIIAVLVAIAIPVYNVATAKAEKGACVANLRMIDGAIQQYINNNGTDPEFEDLKDYFRGGTPECPDKVNGGYELKEIDGYLRAECKKHGHDYDTNVSPTPADEGGGD